MLNQCEILTQTTEGRYATDAELDFLVDYVNTYPKRLSLYQKIQSVESDIVQSVYERMKRDHPQLLQANKKSVSRKWKQDTLRTLRCSAMAVLLDDPATLQERYLLWFQTVMSAFNVRSSCDVTYSIMQEVIAELLTADEVALLGPILELNRTALGMNH